MLVALGLAGCRLSVQRLEQGTPWSPDGFEALEPHVSDRGVVLDELGPPHRVFYTLTEEIFEYQYSAHTGWNLDFILPTNLIPVFSQISPAGAALRFLTPAVLIPDEFQDREAVVSSTDFVLNQGFGVAPVPGGDSIAVQNRALRSNVLRVTLDRESHLVLVKEILWVVDPEEFGWEDPEATS